MATRHLIGKLWESHCKDKVHATALCCLWGSHGHREIPPQQMRERESNLLKRQQAKVRYQQSVPTTNGDCLAL